MQQHFDITDRRGVLNRAPNCLAMLIVENDMLKVKSKVSLFRAWQLHRPLYCFASWYRLCVASHNLYRDAKHSAGLNNCLSTDLRKIEFHKNASFASVNIAKADCNELGIPFSISSCKSIIHNAYMLNRFICVSGLRPDSQIIDKLFKELVYLLPEPLRRG